MSPQSLADDLAYIHDLAEAGQRAPLLGGRFLAWWGGLTMLAYLGQYLIVSGIAGLPLSMISFMWIGFAVIGLSGYFLLVRTFSCAKPGRGSVGNKVSALVWKSAGMFLFVFFLGLTAKSFTQGSAASEFGGSVALVVGIYGMAQFVAGQIANSRVLTFAGVLALLSTVPAILLTGSDLIWLLGAAVAGVTLLLPGIVLMRNEPSETV